MATRQDRIINGLTVVVALCALTLMAATTWERYGPDPLNRADRLLDNRAIVEQGRRIGPANAPVSIVEFGDYQCGACRAYHARIREILAAYPKQVAFIYRHYPLPYHDLARPAARAAECAAAQARFPSYHEALMAGAKWQLDPAQGFVRLAEEVGVGDMEAFNECIEDPSPVPKVERDLALGKEIGVPATPTIIINGLMFGRAPSLEELTERIDEVLER